MATWPNDPITKNVAIQAADMQQLRQLVEGVVGPQSDWIDNPITNATTIKAAHFTQLQAKMRAVWTAKGIPTWLPMLWTQTVPGSGSLGGPIRATHLDDLRRWYDTSQQGLAGYQFPKVRPLLFGIVPSWQSQQPAGQQYYTDDQMLSAIKAAGATCVRWGVGWDAVEPNPPDSGGHHYYFAGEQGGENYDYEVNKALQYGLTYIMDVQGCPTWANNNDSQKRMPPTSAHTADYQAFVTALAQHFLGRVRHYECVNEPNGFGDWNYPQNVNNDYDRGRTYAPYLKYFHDAIKAVDSGAWVASGGVDSLQGPVNFVWGLYAWCYANGYTSPYPFDAVACHPYPQSYPPPQPIDEGSGTPANCPLPQNPPTALLQGTGILGLRQLMTCSPYLDYGKPLWLTEYGYHRNSFVPPPDAQTQQASNLQGALDWLSQESQNYITTATFQIAVDMLGPGSSASDMGLLQNSPPPTPLLPYPAYSTFSGYSKPTT